MAEKVETSFIIKAITEGFEKAAEQFDELNKKTDSTGEESKKANVSLLELYAGVQLAGQAAQVAAAAFKEMFDAGYEGAKIEQTSRSFDMLTESVNMSADALLDDFSQASRGTVDEVSAMEGMLTLTAGASKEMQAQLLEAAPSLMEIAKAANKVNPSLGDTATLYESITTGIKRGSPMILDNLGIVVKVGEANEAYADALGKTVEELTAEEKILALLNATQKAGNNLIEQAGGDVSSLTDEYEKNKAELKAVADELKRNATPAITDFVSFLNKAVTSAKTLVSWNRKLKDTYIEHGEEVARTASSYDEYIAIMASSSKMSEEQLRYSAEHKESFKQNAVVVGTLTEAEWEAARAQEYWNNEASRYEAMAAQFTGAVEEVGDGVFDLTKLTEEQRDAWDEAQKKQKEYIDYLISAPWGDLYSDFAQDASDLAEEHAELTDELDTLTTHYPWLRDEIQEVTDKLAENEDKQRDLTQAREDDIAMMLFQMASEDLSAEAALALAESMGLVDEKTRAVDEAMLYLKETNDINKDGMIDNAEETDGYIEQLGYLNDALNTLDGKEVTSKVLIREILLNSLGMGDYSMESEADDFARRSATTHGFAQGGTMFVPGGTSQADGALARVSAGEKLTVTPVTKADQQTEALNRMDRNLRNFTDSFKTELTDAILIGMGGS